MAVLVVIVEVFVIFNKPIKLVYASTDILIMELILNANVCYHFKYIFYSKEIEFSQNYKI